MLLGTDEKTALWKTLGLMKDDWITLIIALVAVSYSNSSTFRHLICYSMNYLLPSSQRQYLWNFYVFLLPYKFFICTYKSFALVSSDHLLDVVVFWNRDFHQMLINNNVCMINALVNHLTAGLPNWFKAGLVFAAFTYLVGIFYWNNWSSCAKLEKNSTVCMFRK